MTSTAIITRTAAIALGAFLALHQPASAGMTPTLQTATSGGASWTYTAGATGRTYTISPRSRAPTGWAAARARRRSRP